MGGWWPVFGPMAREERRGDRENPERQKEGKEERKVGRKAKIRDCVVCGGEIQGHVLEVVEQSIWKGVREQCVPHH